MDGKAPMRSPKPQSHPLINPLFKTRIALASAEEPEFTIIRARTKSHRPNKIGTDSDYRQKLELLM